MSQISFAYAKFMEYWGNGQYLILFLVALIFLVFRGKEMWQNHYLGKIVLLILICSFNPLGVYVINRCIGEIVFWRIFWTLPSSIVIAYALIQVLYSKFKSDNGMKTGFLFAIFVLALCGNYMYHTEDFQKAPNKWQIPAEAVKVCDIVKEDAALEGVTVKMTAPPEISNYARQYDASILLLAGRNTNTAAAKRVRKIYGGALSETTVKRLIRVSKKKECNYLVCYKDPIFEQIVEKRGYKILTSTDNFVICKRIQKE